MSHHDHDPFETLRGTTPPPARPDARAAALAAARAAYDDAQAKKNAAPSKGNSAAWRLKSIIQSLKGFSIMDARIPLGTAAIALLLLPLGLQYYNSTALTPVTVPAWVITRSGASQCRMATPFEAARSCSNSEAFIWALPRR